MFCLRRSIGLWLRVPPSSCLYQVIPESGVNPAPNFCEIRWRIDHASDRLGRTNLIFEQRREAGEQRPQARQSAGLHAES
jgi:hypothetical protein